MKKKKRYFRLESTNPIGRHYGPWALDVTHPRTRLDDRRLLSGPAKHGRVHVQVREYLGVRR